MDIVDYSRIERQLQKLPNGVLVAFRAWVKTIEMVGLWETQKMRGYRDHTLKGQRRGQRATCFGRSYRVIYEPHKSGEIYIIRVEKVTKHDYRRKG